MASSRSTWRCAWRSTSRYPNAPARGGRARWPRSCASSPHSARDPAFWRIALCIGASQFAAVSLGTLWVATWLRDVAGYTQAEVARALLLFAVAMIAGYLGFGRIADAMTRAGRSTLPLLAGGVATGSACLALLALGVRTGALALWTVFFTATSAVVLSYALFARRYPKEMSGRVNTALNVFVFIGHVHRAMGRRRGAQLLAADRGRLRARGLPLGAGAALDHAVQRARLALERAPAIC